MGYWSIVQTHSQRERLAAEQLAQRGFHVYLPKIRITTKLGGRRVHSLVPLFPSYLFLRIDRVWYPVLSTVGVLRVLRNADREPARLDDEIINEIRGREVRGIIKLPKPVRIGDRVRIVRGSFRDHVGVYEGMSGKERERVLLDLLGRKVPVELDPEDFVALNVAP
jgi:transcriptional antiterminator RfaH